MNEIYVKVADLGIDYDFGNKDIISIEELAGALETVLYEKSILEEKYEDFRQDVEDNYKPMTPSEIYGMWE